MPNNKRSFTIEFDGQKFGRLISGTPRQAAQKAVNCMARRHASGELTTKYQANDWNEFRIIETTRGSNKKTFGYKGIRKERDEPVQAQIAGKTITCKFDTQVYSTRGAANQAGGAKKKATRGKKKVARKTAKKVAKKAAKKKAGSRKKAGSKKKASRGKKVAKRTGGKKKTTTNKRK